MEETQEETYIQTNSSFVKKIYLTRSQVQKWVSEFATFKRYKIITFEISY